eukprot:15465376-Heterocapsa_arctica.AAC.1
MEKAKQIQAHKRNKCKITNNAEHIAEEQEIRKESDSANDTNPDNEHLVENRRRQYQGYLDQKEVRLRKEAKGDSTNDTKRQQNDCTGRPCI